MKTPYTRATGGKRWGELHTRIDGDEDATVTALCQLLNLSRSEVARLALRELAARHNIQQSKETAHHEQAQQPQLQPGPVEHPGADRGKFYPNPHVWGRPIG